MREFYPSGFYIFSLIILLSFDQFGALDPPKPDQANAGTVSPCSICKSFVKSFHKGIEKTKKSKHEGGDVDWEEKNQKPYSISEIRLTDILDEHVCKDLKKHEAQCHDIAGDYQTEIEEWWKINEKERPDLFEYLCVNNAKKCCLKGKFGKNCQECSGYPDKICNNNGKCRGSGSRKGNGKCDCDKGYSGEYCSECTKGYYESYKDDNKLLCSACHGACVDGCTSGGSGNCLGGCNQGWKLVDDNNNCVDVNECLETKNICSGNQFCINNDGSHSCLNCDKSCDGCTGDGPDMCKKCTDGYHEKDNICINSDILGRKTQENFARYATYFGLCVATCIIFQNNVYAASAIGLLVGLYISISEYILATSSVQNATPNLDLLQPTEL